MASQREDFPPTQFSITTPFQNVRLLEVSDEILNIIKNSKSGDKPTLKFKSAPSLTSAPSLIRHSSTNKVKDSILHLCSDDKAWAVKQVSTSNSVYLIQPSRPDLSPIDNVITTTKTSTTNGDVDMNDSGDDNNNNNNNNNNEEEEDGIGNGMISRGHATATSQVRNFLELHPAQIHESEIEQALFDLVPIYHPLDGDDDHEQLAVDMMAENSVVTSQDQLIDDIAAPDAIVSRVCMRLCIFDLVTKMNSGCSYIPSPSVLLGTWTRIIEGCSIVMIRLDHAIVPSRIIGTLDNPQDKSIAETMLKSRGMFESIGLIESSNDTSSTFADEMSDGSEGTRYLRPEKTCDFVAELILKAHVYDLSVSTNQPASQKGIGVGVFIEKWTTLVPSSFVKHCTLESLRSKAGITVQKESGSDDEMVRWVGNETELISSYINDKRNAASSAVSTAEQQESVTKPVAPGKRKWHEKFGAQRNALKR